MTLTKLLPPARRKLKSNSWQRHISTETQICVFNDNIPVSVSYFSFFLEQEGNVSWISFILDSNLSGIVQCWKMLIATYFSHHHYNHPLWEMKQHWFRFLQDHIFSNLFLDPALYEVNGNLSLWFQRNCSELSVSWVWVSSVFAIRLWLLPFGGPDFANQRILSALAEIDGIHRRC